MAATHRQKNEGPLIRRSNAGPGHFTLISMQIQGYSERLEVYVNTARLKYRMKTSMQKILMKIPSHWH